MTQNLSILIVEDAPDDAEILLRHVSRGRPYVTHKTVDSIDDVVRALSTRTWDVVLCDFNLVGFNALAVLDVVREQAPGTPVIVVSGKIGEETAISTLKAGAADYIMKDKPARLPAAIDRAMQEAIEKQARVRAEVEKAAVSANLQAVVEAAIDGILTVDSELRIEMLNSAAEALFGYTEKELIGQALSLLFPPQYRDEYTRLIGRTVFGAMSQAVTDTALDSVSATIELTGLRKDQTTVPIEISVGAMHPSGSDPKFTIVVRNITERKDFEARLSYHVLHDSLTSLPNRVTFLDRLEHALERSTGDDEKHAVLFIDIDRFKVINDSLGHDLGDELLNQVASVFMRALRSGDTLARFGGDEFTILCENISSPAAAVEVAETIFAALRQPFELDGAEVHITASVGIALCAEGSMRPEEILRDADAAMNRAKAQGGDCYVIFDERVRETVVTRLETENALRQAIDQDELHIEYQPEIEMGTGQIVGAEALLRWKHPIKGTIMPPNFIPLAEETGLILEIGNWVVQSACEALAAWPPKVTKTLQTPLGLDQPRASNSDAPDFDGRENKAHAPFVSINISARQLRQPGFVETVEAAAQASGIDTAQLCFEITETVLLDHYTQAIQVLNELRDLGVQLALDDFGTGFSSLTYLQRLPVQMLKIDRSFVNGLQTNARDTAIVGAIIHLAHALDLKVVAEGVESEIQIQTLRKLGCDLAQGYLIAHPLGAEAIAELLASS